MTQGTLIGIRKFNSKKGLPLCTVEITYPFMSQDYDNGNAVGNRTYSGFVPQGFDINTLDAKCIGKTYNVEIAYYNNANHLVYMAQA